jgi:2-keto-4-pentenoate hydratase/2-oxohepta-3-ene-1,7-dioic acid hydratase in catechol pathway
MRLVTYIEDDGPRVGVLDGANVCAMPAGVSLVDLLGDEGERLADAGARALTDPAGVHGYDEIRMMAPIPSPPTVHDFMTFESHCAGVRLMISPEATVPPQWYDAPAFYFSNPYAVIGPDDPVPVPAELWGRRGRDAHAPLGADDVVTVSVDQFGTLTGRITSYGQL